MKSFFVLQDEQINVEWEQQTPLKGLESRRTEKQLLDGKKEDSDWDKKSVPDFYYWPKTV